MTNEERKAIVRELLAKGYTLSQVQDYLHKEKGDHLTYMELRLLLAEMPDALLPEKEPAKPPAQPAATAPSPEKGKLSISVDQMPPPGAMLSGYVRFPSGAKAHWFIDEMGRLALEPELGSEKPTQSEVREFSAELRKMLQAEGV
ncbi:MAG: hypothetical protein N3B01_11105 [Verrucomicrobiae bacterium]|nr:hypothetical protein [Verrucomicrobiae bacterium]